MFDLYIRQIWYYNLHHFTNEETEAWLVSLLRSKEQLKQNTSFLTTSTQQSHWFLSLTNYSWPFNIMGLNCVDSLIHRYFSINNTALHNLWWIELTVQNRIQWNKKYRGSTINYTRSSGCVEGQHPNPYVKGPLYLEVEQFTEISYSQLFTFMGSTFTDLTNEG